jgi:hypothetical protein
LKAPSVDGIPIAPRAIDALLSSIGAITCANAVTEKSSIPGSPTPVVQRLIISRLQAVGRLLAGARSVRERTAYENPEIISRRYQGSTRSGDSSSAMKAFFGAIRSHRPSLHPQ